MSAVMSYSTYTPGSPGWQASTSAPSTRGRLAPKFDSRPRPVPPGFSIAAGPVQPWIPGVTSPNQSMMVAQEGEEQPIVMVGMGRRGNPPSVVVACRTVLTGAFVVATTSVPAFAFVTANRFFPGN